MRKTKTARVSTPSIKIPRGYVLLHKSQLKTLGKKKKRVRTASQIRADKKRMAELRAKIGKGGKTNEPRTKGKSKPVLGKAKPAQKGRTTVAPNKKATKSSR